MKLAPGVFARYYESGHGSIQLHFTFRGVRCKETLPGLDPSVKNHVSHAINRRASVMHDIARDCFNYLEHFPESKRAALFGFVVSKRTVREIAESWLSDMKRALPHSTYRSYEGPCDRFVYPAIGDMRIRDVTVEHLRRMFREADISLKTARNYSIPLRAIFQRAIDDDDIDRNPMDRINVKTLIPKARHTTAYVVDPFSLSEIDAILAAARDERPGWANYIAFQFYTGMRPSETYGLTWADVDLENRTVSVTKAVVERQLKEPKTLSSVREVHLVDQALQALKRQRAVTGLTGKAVFVDPRDHSALYDYQISERVFDTCQRVAGVRRRNQYQMRHTFASNMLSAGENPLWVARQMGHKNVTMLFQVYAKWIPTTSNFGQICPADVPQAAEAAPASPQVIDISDKGRASDE